MTKGSVTSIGLDSRLSPNAERAARYQPRAPLLANRQYVQRATRPSKVLRMFFRSDTHATDST